MTTLLTIAKYVLIPAFLDKVNIFLTGKVFVTFTYLPELSVILEQNMLILLCFWERNVKGSTRM